MSDSAQPERRTTSEERADAVEIERKASGPDTVEQPHNDIPTVSGLSHTAKKRRILLEVGAWLVLVIVLVLGGLNGAGLLWALVAAVIVSGRVGSALAGAIHSAAVSGLAAFFSGAIAGGVVYAAIWEIMRALPAFNRSIAVGAEAFVFLALIFLWGGSVVFGAVTALIVNQHSHRAREPRVRADCLSSVLQRRILRDSSWGHPKMGRLMNGWVSIRRSLLLDGRFSLTPARRSRRPNRLGPPSHTAWRGPLLGALLIGAAAMPTRVVAATLGGITEFSTPTPNSAPQGIAVLPDGNMWFVEQSGKVGRSSPSGRIDEFSIPSANSNPSGIVAGPGGNAWFTETGASKIGRITPGGTITEFATPTPASAPTEIGVDAIDGNLWFTEAATSKIGRITPGGTITEFTIPTPNSHPMGITPGPDFKMWFTERDGNKIGAIDRIGFFNELAIPTAGALPLGIVTGPDGFVWFTESATGANKIGQVRFSTINEFSIPTPESGASGITDGPDANLWFAESGANKLGEISTTGQFIEVTLPMAGSAPHGVTAGPDGNLWFTESGVSAIGRLVVIGGIAEFPIPSHDIAPQSIAAGPDGNLWFTEFSSLGRITPRGVITEFPLSTASYPWGITSGPDGNIWATEDFTSRIVRMTPMGSATEFALPITNATPHGITAGPDGNLWFAESNACNIGRITTSGIITEIPIPGCTYGQFASSIAVGPDGNIWYLAGLSILGKITLPTLAFKQYTIPDLNGRVNSVTAGPDGNMWFTDEQSGNIGKLNLATETFVLFQFGDPLCPSCPSPRGIASGPDGNLWFARLD